VKVTEGLRKLDNATRMLAEVRDAKDAKHVMDIASAAEHYARKQKLGEEAIGHAHSIKIEAQAMLGAFLEQAEKHIGGRPSETSCDLQPVSKPSTLADLGLTKEESVNSQLLAAIRNEQPEEFEKIKTREKKLTQVKRERTRAKAIKKVSEFPSGKFRVVYADPPWKYGDTLAGDLDSNYGGAEKHYPSMSITELASLPVKEHCDQNAVLFLWVTSPLLFQCEPVFEAWGFSYKSAFIWDKVKHNMGHYNSVRHELLLICTRGSCTPDVNRLFDSVQSIERAEKHSEKPEAFRNIIDTLYPNGRRVEMFARGSVPGNWESWGAEAEEKASA